MLSLATAYPWLPCNPLSPSSFPGRLTLSACYFTQASVIILITLEYTFFFMCLPPPLDYKLLEGRNDVLLIFQAYNRYFQKISFNALMNQSIKTMFIPASESYPPPPSDFLLGRPHCTLICLDYAKPSHQIKTHQIKTTQMDPLCVCVCVCMCAQSCLTLCSPMDCSLPWLCPWNFPGKNTGVGYHFLLQRIFPTQGI